jgi:hypothetical protein
MVAAVTQSQLSGLGRAMVQKGLLAERDAEQIQVRANEAGLTFVEELIGSKKFNEGEVAEFAAHTFGFPLVDLNAFDTDHLPTKFIEPKALQSRRALPLYQRGNRLFVGISDPTNRAAMDQIKFQTGLHVEAIVVEDSKLGNVIVKLLAAAGINLKDLVEEEMAADLTEAEPPEAVDTGAVEIDDAPVVRYIQKILLDAINNGASDIHFEPYEKVYRIRYRIDGELYEVATPAARDQGEGRLSYQGDLQARYLGEARAAGRPHEAGAVQDPGDRLPREHAADLVRRETGAAYSRLLQRYAGDRGARLRTGPERGVDVGRAAALRHGPGHRPDRFG